MKRRHKIILWSIIATPIVCVLLYFLVSFTAVIIYTEYELRSAEKRKSILLYETDYKVLWQACMQVMKEAKEGKWEYRQYNIRIASDPGIDKLPQQILDINPTYILIDHRLITLEMMGGMSHFGVVAYPRDYLDELGRDEYEKFAGGLWWYDDETFAKKLWHYNDEE